MRPNITTIDEAISALDRFLSGKPYWECNVITELDNPTILWDKDSQYPLVTITPTNIELHRCFLFSPYEDEAREEAGAIHVMSAVTPFFKCERSRENRGQWVLRTDQFDTELPLAVWNGSGKEIRQWVQHANARIVENEKNYVAWLKKAQLSKQGIRRNRALRHHLRLSPF